MNQRTAKNTGWESGIQVATVPLILTIKLSYAGSCLVIKTSLMPSLMLARVRLFLPLLYQMMTLLFFREWIAMAILKQMRTVLMERTV